MAAVTVAQVRQRFRDRLLGLGGWLESTVPALKWPGSGVPRNAGSSTAHRLFGVAVLSTVDTHRYARSNPAEGAHVESDVRVRCLFRVLAGDQVDAEDTAHGLAHDAVKRLMAYESGWPGDLKVSWESTTPGVVPTGEWYRYELRFRVQHLLALA